VSRRDRRAGESRERRVLRSKRKKLDRRPIVAKVRLSAEQFAAIPVSERRFLVAIGRFANEIAILSKLAWWCTKDGDVQNFDGAPRLSQALTLLLLLAGKLNEGWLMIGEAYNRDLGQEYASRLDDESKASLKELGQYFGRRNRIHRARNTFGFHYDVAAIERALEPLSQYPGAELYFGHHHLNSFYGISEVALQESVAREMDANNPRAGVEGLMDDTAAVTHHLLQFIDGFAHALLEKHLGVSRARDYEEIDVSELAGDDAEVDIPYFVKNPTRRRS
jgi:hypothetical protein